MTKKRQQALQGYWLPFCCCRLFVRTAVLILTLGCFRVRRTVQSVNLVISVENFTGNRRGTLGTEAPFWYYYSDSEFWIFPRSEGNKHSIFSSVSSTVCINILLGCSCLSSKIISKTIKCPKSLRIHPCNDFIPVLLREFLFIQYFALELLDHIAVLIHNLARKLRTDAFSPIGKRAGILRQLERRIFADCPKEAYAMAAR